jgi:SAM-dependent methyltransferase
MPSFVRRLIPDSLVLGARQLLHRYTDAKANYWKAQDLSSIERYWSNRDDAGSRYLVRLLEGYAFESLLEIGCNCGNRLFSIAKRFPSVKLAGIDINALAINKGKQWLQKEGMGQIDLRVMRVEDPAGFEPKSFDLVLSWATLIYVRPRDIESVLCFICSVAKKAVLLIEMHGASEGAAARGTYCPPGNWKRDYVQLIRRGHSGRESPEIGITNLPEDIWNPSGGGGAVISVRMPGPAAGSS